LVGVDRIWLDLSQDMEEYVAYATQEMYSLLSDWWFGTFSIFHNIWDNPSQLTLICLKMLETTNQ
jgi:hypothetical protein